MFDGQCKHVGRSCNSGLQGCAEDQNGLGVCLEKRGEVEEAKVYYQLSAEQGYDKAQFNLGDLAFFDDNKEEAKFWYKKAAEQGHARAQFMLGALLYDETKIEESKQ